MQLTLFASIRNTLILLVLLAVLPALGIVLYTGYELRDKVVKDAQNYALRQVQAMASHHERVVDNARLLLMTLAKAAEVRRLDAPACNTLLADILARNTAYVSLTLADGNGQVIAATPPADASNIQERAYFQKAISNMDFTVGDYTLLEAQHRVVIQFAQPIADGPDSPAGVLTAAFDLSYFGRIFFDIGLPANSVFTLTDAHGTRLTRFPQTDLYTWVPDLPQMVARMSGPEQEGAFLETGVDGMQRLYGFKRLHFKGAAFPHLMIRLGIPVEQALAEAKAVVTRNVALLLLATALALAIAWFVGEFAIMRRLKQLMAATRRLEQGDLSARSGLSSTRGELGRLAAAFDSMADSLESKERQRQQAEEQILHLNVELEERVVQRTRQLADANLELQSALEDLRRTQNQLVMSEKLAALGELVAGVAHEINTPVGVALSAGSTLVEKNRQLSALFARGEMKRSDLNGYLDDAREGVQMILANLNRASELIRSFKMVAADQVSEARRAFNVKRYIEELLLSLRPKLKKTGHRVEVVCDDALEIESYPGAFSQILANFIINSLNHAFAADQQGEIRIEVLKRDATLELRYTDNGKGMPTEVREKIFEPFFTTARSQGSTGLGMHIVFNIVTRTLGGTIACESHPGQGTHFRVTMPV